VEEKFPAVYILANKPHGVIYVGVTSALWNSVASHKDGSIAGFTKKYDVKRLVWYEHHHSMSAAIAREKRIEDWKRAWKVSMIEKFNPQRHDLYDCNDYSGSLIEPVLEADPGLRRDDGF
jgi:putative endonuclease